MKQRVTFGFKDKRRDQRRPVTIEGSIRGTPVHLIDVSFSGVGGAMELRRAAKEPSGDAELGIEEGEETTLEFNGADDRQMSLRVTIQRIDPDTGAFGATFAALSSAQFDTIEKLMFPRRGAAAYR